MRRLDVVVNNAGYGHFGMIEEVTEEEIRAQLETNVLGALWVTQAAKGFSQSLSQEVASFGVKVTLVEPAGYSTHWSGSSAGRFAAPGNPVATRDAILQLVDADNPPLRLFLGESPLRIAVADYGTRLTAWAQWQQVAAACATAGGRSTRR